MNIQIFTDGSARNNGKGSGGYGAILLYGSHKKEISGSYRCTTNNRMELLSVLEALKAMKTKNVDLEIYSDSKYVVDSITKGWVDTWDKNKYKNRKNSDLWKEFQLLRKDFNIRMIWVKGHADNYFNNECDKLATAASSDDNKQNWKIDTFYENQNNLNLLF